MRASHTWWILWTGLNDGYVYSFGEPWTESRQDWETELRDCLSSIYESEDQRDSHELIFAEDCYTSMAFILENRSPIANTCPTEKDYLGVHYILWLLGLASFENGRKHAIPRSCGYLTRPDFKHMAMWDRAATTEGIIEAMIDDQECTKTMDAVVNKNLKSRRTKVQRLTS